MILVKLMTCLHPPKTMLNLSKRAETESLAQHCGIGQCVCVCFVCMAGGGGGAGIKEMNPNPIIVLPFGAESYITRQISTVSQVLLTFIVA